MGICQNQEGVVDRRVTGLQLLPAQEFLPVAQACLGSDADPRSAECYQYIPRAKIAGDGDCCLEAARHRNRYEFKEPIDQANVRNVAQWGTARVGLEDQVET
jgi:hypothetical protein